MSENAEQVAEATILAAVMAPEQHISPPDAQDLDDPQKLATDAEAAEEGEEEEAPEVEAKEAEPEAPAEDEIEIPGEDGKEPTKLKVSEVLEGYRQFKAIETQKAQVIERIEREAVEVATSRLKEVEDYAKQTAYGLQAALHLLQAPQPPNADRMLDPRSPEYDPDGYHRAFAQYQQSAQRYQMAQQLGGDLMKQAQAAQQQAQAQRETAELQRLKRVWPEFDSQDTINKFVSDMGKAYGYSPEELDASLTDHRNALVARDALKWRELQAKSGEVKKAVETKPKLVRSKQINPKAGNAQQRDAKGQYVSDSLARLRKTNSDDDAAAFFAGLAKAGRI